ncbi:MAG: hypothetical protein V9G08_06035 [Dermatophilaceae bacterium]
MTWPLNRWLLPALAILVFFGVVGLAATTGAWVTSGRTLVAGGSGAGGGSAQSGEAGTGAGSGAERVGPAPGSVRPADLKGWMTLQQAADGLGISLADLVAAIGPPAGVTLSPQTPLKDVEALVPGFSLTGLRAALGG